MQKHTDDQLSVAAWVCELKSLDYNPVLMFKPQGEQTDINGLCDDDILLGSFNVKLFGAELICMDATLGMTSSNSNCP